MGFHVLNTESILALCLLMSSYYNIQMTNDVFISFEN